MTPEVKTNVRRETYYITVSRGAKLEQSVQVVAEGVRDALKKAYEKVSGWQGVPPDDL